METKQNLYEGMFIFPDRFREEDLDGIIKSVRGEIEKLSGEVVSSTRLGRRSFARPLQKMDFGHYAVITFTIAGGQLPALHVRFKLSDDVLRVQIVSVKVSETLPG